MNGIGQTIISFCCAIIPSRLFIYFYSTNRWHRARTFCATYSTNSWHRDKWTEWSATAVSSWLFERLVGATCSQIYIKKSRYFTESRALIANHCVLNEPLVRCRFFFYCFLIFKFTFYRYDNNLPLITARSHAFEKSGTVHAFNAWFTQAFSVSLYKCSRRKF